MKKKFLLAVIPALMALSSCTFMESATNVKGNGFLEDCLAHEEIFGEVNLEERSLQPRRALDPSLNPDVCYEHPTIGVQSFYNSEKNEVSFRFVAAVTMDSESVIANSSAVWTRCVSKTDCSSYPLDEATPAPTINKAYKALSNDGGSYTIDQYNTDHANGEGPTHYTHFIVYTLRNIKLSNYPGSSYYVSAYLTMSGYVTGGPEHIYSKAIAIRFDRLKKYTYVHNVGSAFMEGTVNSAAFYRDATTVGSTYGDDVASFTGVSLSNSDKVVIKEFDGTKLKIRNVSDFVGNDNHSDYYLTNDNGEMKPKFEGTYNYDFYLNSDHQIYVNSQNIVRPIYVSLNENASWWHDGDAEGEDAWTAVYAFGASGSHWYKTSVSGDYLVTSAAINPTVYTTVIVVRMKYSSRNKAEADLSWDDKYHNQTINMPIKNSDSLPDKAENYKDCIYLKDAEEDGNKKAEWGGRA